jgi:predicted ester cyclase
LPWQEFEHGNSGPRNLWGVDVANEGMKLGQAVHEAYNSRKFSGPEATISDDFTWTVVAFGAPGSKGVAGYREVMEGWSTAFPDSTVNTTAVIEGVDSEAIQFFFRGTHNGTLATPNGELAPTGRSVDISVCNVYRARNGKLVEAYSYFDAATLMRQLGLGA